MFFPVKYNCLLSVRRPQSYQLLLNMQPLSQRLLLHVTLSVCIRFWSHMRIVWLSISSWIEPPSPNSLQCVQRYAEGFWANLHKMCLNSFRHSSNHNHSKTLKSLMSFQEKNNWPIRVDPSPKSRTSISPSNLSCLGKYALELAGSLSGQPASLRAGDISQCQDLSHRMRIDGAALVKSEKVLNKLEIQCQWISDFSHPVESFNRF